MIRAVLNERPDGTLEADWIVSGWWGLDDLREATYAGSSALGASPEEMDCVLERFADHSRDGSTCDAISVAFEGKTVAARLTGLDDETAGAP